MTGSATNSSRSSAAGPWRVLLVTDNIVDQKLLHGLLSKHHHRVFVARNGQEALGEWSENEFDVVLLDSLLSEMDGAELARTFRSRETRPRRVPILVLSDAESDGDSCLAAGADKCLNRPFQVSEFHESMRHIRQSAARPATTEDPNVDPIDWQVALEAVGGRRDLLREIIDVFFTEHTTTLASIQAAIEGSDAKSLQLYAHQLKGCLRYFGETTACQLARNLEDIGRSGQLQQAASQLPPLTAAVRQLLPHLRQGPP